MKFSLTAIPFLALIVPVGAGDAAPGDQVKAAVQRLADAPNYSWTVTVSSGDKSRFSPGPSEGRTEKDGSTQWKLNFGDRCAEAFTKGDRVAVKTDDGWVKPEEHRPPPPGGAHLPPPRGETLASPLHVDFSPPALDAHSGDERPRGSKAGFLAHQLQSMKAPAELASELAGKVTAFTVSGETVSGDLSPEAVKELLAFGHRRDGHGAPEPGNPRGSVLFSLKGGQLHKLELRLSATMCFNGSELSLDRITVFDIKDVGTTRLVIPAQVQSLLEPALPDKKPA